MRKRWICGLLTAGMLAGCAGREAPTTTEANLRDPAPIESTASTPDAPTQLPDAPVDPVIATVGDTIITRSELEAPLMEAYGLNVLMYIVQRDMARDLVRDQRLNVSPQDIANEREWTLRMMFARAPEDEDREKLLDQYLQQPKPRDEMMTRREFDIVIETNAYMRKIVEAALKGSVSEEALKKQFDERYGASVRVRHIMLANPQEAVQVKRRLAAGEDFAKVAQEMSRNPDTRTSGGLLPPFTANDSRLPENFRQVAFSLDVGQVSEQVQAQGSYHIIKLEERIPPKAVKYEDVKESLRQEIEDQLVLEGVKEIRHRLGAEALATLKITDPILKAEFAQRLAARDKMIRDRDKIKQELEKQREPAATQPATQPATPKPVSTAPVPTAPASTAPVSTAPVSTAPITPKPAGAKPETTPSVTTKPATTKSAGGLR